MPIILMRLRRKFVRLRTGLPPLVVIVFVFTTSWPLMLIVGGIVTLTTVFAQLAEIIEKTKGRRMQGAVTLDIEDHVVVRIVDELVAGGDRSIVLYDVGHRPITRDRLTAAMAAS